MKKAILILMAFALILSLAACGTSATEDTPDYADADFIADLGKALQKRFDAADKLDEKAEKMSDIEYGEGISELIDIELTALSEYRNRPFEDAKLQEYVLSYLNTLQSSKDVFADISTDYYGTTEKYNELYNARLKLISTFVSDYGLSVDSAHADQLKEMTTTGQSVARNDEAKEAAGKVVSNVVFELVENSYGWKTYRGILDNTSGYDMSYVSYDIDLMDANGTVIDQTYASVSNVANGKKYNLEFSTSEDFASYDYTVEYTMAD